MANTAGTTGPRDLSSLVMLTGWDASALLNFKLIDGTTYAQVASLLETAAQGINAELANDTLWASLVTFTDQPQVEYRVGASTSMTRHTEYARSNAERAAMEGHMLPLLAWEHMLGWTWDYLRRARMTQIQADIRNAAAAVRNRYRLALLTRLFKRTDDSGAVNGLGASGLSAGFATAAASTGVDFVPPTVGGTSFDSNHEHYVGITGGAFTDAVFIDAKDELREHGHDGPYEFLIGPSDETTVRAISGFIPVASLANVQQYATTVSIASLPGAADSNSGYYIGILRDFNIRVVRGIPQYYGVGYKSYGPRSALNPLAVRLFPGQSTPQVQVMTNPAAGTGMLPLQEMMLFLEMGVGVNDRTAATPRYTNSATWADPTIT